MNLNIGNVCQSCLLTAFGLRFVILELIRNGRLFVVEPWPDDTFRVYIRPEPMESAVLTYVFSAEAKEEYG